MALLRPKQIDLVALAIALNITQIARNAISVPPNSLLSYTSSTGVLDYQGYISTRTIFVDKSNPKATDTRTSYSKYNRDIPFKTIQAAINASVTGDFIFVMSAAYTENLSLNVAGKTFVIQFDSVTLNSNITLSNYANSSNVLIFTDGSTLTGELITGDNTISPVIIGDGTSVLDTRINTVSGRPKHMVIRDHKLLTTVNQIFEGNDTLEAVYELELTNIEKLTVDSDVLFKTAYLKLSHVNIIHDSGNTEDAIFSGGIVEADNCTIVSVNGRISNCPASFHFKAKNCSFISADFTFYLEASGTKWGQFTNCHIESVEESCFRTINNSGGSLYLKGCTTKVVQTSKYVISSTNELSEIEAFEVTHNSEAGFLAGMFPEVYSVSNLSYSMNL